MKTHLQLLITASCLGALSLTSPAHAQAPSPTAASKMKAIVYYNYGPPDVLQLEEIDKPVPNANQVLVKVRAVSVNPYDWHFIEGVPYIARLLAFGPLKPKLPRVGVDFSGIVEAVGKNVTQFKAGDEVFGGKVGAYAEYVVIAEKFLAMKPANITFEQAGSVQIAGLTALQGLRDKGKIQPGQKVLINGASGGVGTFAVQLAKHFGANVTGVCSGRNVELVRSLGADQVIDYTKEDFTKSGQRYDVIIDNVGNRSLSEYRRVLTPNGKYVLIGGGGVNDNRWTGPIGLVVKLLLMKPFIGQEMKMMLADVNKEDLTLLADLMQSGKVTPVIDKTYPFSEIREAIRYVETGRARGKVPVTLPDSGEVSLAGGNAATSSGSTVGPLFVVLTFIVVPLAVLIGPIVIALALNRRFRRENPEKRSFRWGYYFSVMSFVAVVGLALLLDFGIVCLILCGLVYGILAWFFAERRPWAWIALTILSFNPIAWIINAIYLGRRWREEAALTA
ncbi:MAG TPA: zinc-binding dehydrogenase [Chthoniobacterales bacterium]|nr:zinc-binding dehydrogenase [Chthoniobacterales bacterium]